MASEHQAVLQVDGYVRRPANLTVEDLSRLDRQWQIADVGQLVPGRQGRAVRLEGLLQYVNVEPAAHYLGLHAAVDDFHASIPLADVRASGILIYRLADGPLPADQGGPFRFLIPDPAACHAAEVDECANVKFIDRLELTSKKGHDNRPQDEQQHARLHEKDS